MKYHDLLIERDGALVRVILNRPGSLNALSARILKELKNVALDFQDDPDIRVVILTGASGNFTAGMDLKDPEVQKMSSGTMSERRERVILGPEVCRAWEETKPVTIAAIEGFCIGGGVSLVISCDFRIMGQSSFMRIPEVELGLNYSWGSIPRLLHLAGPAKTKEMIMLCEPVQAEKCLTWGLAEQVVPDGSTGEAAQAMAEKILEKPPIPVSMTKQAVFNITGALDRAGIYMDADQFLLTTYTEDHKEGVGAFFGKRKPRFKGK
ncbi:MAG: enoyl-CoA hydratase/isomerase family protein [Deltaproteobacteria bacterium]|nr:enoyl-CoA hydratase/isomerase family protein [Deltaproteobacteria bacterium]